MKPSAMKRLIALLRIVAGDSDSPVVPMAKAGSQYIWVTRDGAREVLKTLK